MKNFDGRVFCIHGLLGSGKSTAATYLVKKHGFERDKFAGTLKKMLWALLEDAAVDPERIERYLEGSQADKDEPIPELRGITARHLMKKIGTEFRDMIYPELWVDTSVPRVNRYLEYGRPVVIDDFRFVHEYEVTSQEYAGKIVYVALEPKDFEKRKDSDQHQSERPLPDWMFHYKIRNNGTLEQLQKAMDLIQDVAIEALPDQVVTIEASRVDLNAKSLEECCQNAA